MTEPVRSRLSELLPWGLGLFATGMVLALVVAYSGIFNVAASAGHPDLIEWFLQLAKERSVKFNSKSINQPSLELVELVPLGAAHFQGTCAICHGTLLHSVNPLFGHMLPHPPDLQLHATHWTRGQLFWITRHGIQFTGMPAWSGENRNDEVWAVVAFLEALPSMNKADYRRFSSGHSVMPNYAAEKLVSVGRPRQNLTACSRCHDTDAAAPISPYVPRIGGQNKTYLIRALHDYQDDLRQSGFMEPVASDLDDEQIERLATYYASLTPAFHPTTRPTSLAERDLGRLLVEQGDRPRKIPACKSCHGPKGREDYSRLTGQSEQYLTQQLLIWRQGGRNKTPHGAMMSVVAKRMTEQQVKTAASFYASELPAVSADPKAVEALRQ